MKETSGKRILVVVDMQNDFITGSLGNQDCKIVADRIRNKLILGYDNYDKIYFTKDTHFDGYSDTLEGKKIPKKHCISDTFGWEFESGIKGAIKVLENRGKDIEVINKDTFGSDHLTNVLVETTGCNDIIELCGVCTDICVISNALSLRQAMPNRIIEVMPYYCAGTSIENHNAAIQIMHNCCIDIVN